MRFALLAVLLLAAAGPARAAERPANVVEVVDAAGFDAALAGAGKRTVVVDVWAEWCASCKKLSAELDKLATAHPDDLTIIRFNCDKVPALKERFAVGDSLPLMIKFAGGKEVAREVGYVNGDVIARWLELGK